MNIELKNKINVFLDNVEEGYSTILIKDAFEVENLKEIAMKSVKGATCSDIEKNEKLLNETVDFFINQKKQYTNIFNNLSKMILKAGELELFMRINALNEVAVIKDCGARHFYFHTDWKETIWRKKLVKAANKYIDYKDPAYLYRTIRYIAEIRFLKFPIEIPAERLMRECMRVITTNMKYCEKYPLDISTVENTNNPLDDF